MRCQIILPILSGLAAVSALQPDLNPTGKLNEGSPVYDGLPVPGTTGVLGDAAIINDNPKGVTYTATLPGTNGIRGYISATSNANGTGVFITVHFSGLPNPALGPFPYHIHVLPVPANGNCTETLGHLDPYKRGEIPPCDNTQPQTCQVGDLSGKHGNITATTFSASYLELYASNVAGIGAFLGNASINIHTSNVTRLTCANFELTSNGTNNGTNSSSSTNSTTVSTSTPKPSSFTGGASEYVASIGAVAASFLAFAFFL